MEKQEYEKLKDIGNRITKGEPTTFAERNIYNIYIKNKVKKAKNQSK